MLKISKGQKILKNIFENSLPINYWNKYIYIYIYNYTLEKYKRKISHLRKNNPWHSR